MEAEIIDERLQNKGFWRPTLANSVGPGLPRSLNKQVCGLPSLVASPKGRLRRAFVNAWTLEAIREED